MEVFESEANFSDLSHVDLAYSTTKDKEHHVAIYADLEAFRLVYQVDEVTVCTIQCRNLGDLNDYLGSMVFDEMITFAEEQYNRQLPIINEMRQQADQQAKTELKPDNAPEVLAAFDAYNRLKEQNPDYMVAVQVGDHYETYGSDAVTAGGIWESTMRVPESMAGSKLYGVELDSLTGRMAQQLYQKSSIAVQGFEKTDLPDSFFDLAVGNVPFGSYKLSDKRYDKHNFMIHDYFFAKTLDKVRPGGIVAFITSKGTMDKKNPAVRKYIAQRAELLGAIRLPNTAFQANANTKATTDILFLQRHYIRTAPGAGGGVWTGGRIRCGQ